MNEPSASGCEIWMSWETFALRALPEFRVTAAAQQRGDDESLVLPGELLSTAPRIAASELRPMRSTGSSPHDR